MSQIQQGSGKFVQWERHLQTVMIALITGSIFFAANYFYNDNQSKGVVKLQLDTLTNQVIELRADIKALQFNYVKREEFRELEERVRRIENRNGGIDRSR
jgi:hypothetical protein